MLTTILTQTRLTLRDNVSPYRWSDSDLIGFTNEGIREAIAKRPDLNLDSNGNLVTVTDIPATGNYTYTKSESPATADMLGHELITGWIKTTYPTLYFYAFGTGVTRAYVSSANRTTGVAAGDDTAAIFRFIHTVAGTVTLTTLNTSGFAGQITVINIPTTTDAWAETASEKAMILSNEYDRTLIHFICHKCFEMDSEDTGNAQRMQYHYQRFLSTLYGA